MILPHIENIHLTKITEDIILCHQIKASSLFTCCDGLLILPKKGRNSKTIVLDANLESKHVEAVFKEYGPVSDYVCSHTHLDHSAHVHIWEELGARIHAPIPEHQHLLGGKIILQNFGFLDYVSMSTGESFIRTNGYQECKKVHPFNPGNILNFENVTVETIALIGHSIGHVGFFLPEEKLLHISCLGFDQPEPDIDKFGPWYGFKTCSIPQYQKDIDFAESIFLNRAKILTSSHSYIVKHPDTSPFHYMRRRISENQEKVDKALGAMKIKPNSPKEIIEGLLKLDLFFPKSKMSGFMLEIFTLWEYWFIKNHLDQSKILK